MEVINTTYNTEWEEKEIEVPVKEIKSHGMKKVAGSNGLVKKVFVGPAVYAEQLEQVDAIKKVKYTIPKYIPEETREEIINSYIEEVQDEQNCKNYQTLQTYLDELQQEHAQLRTEQQQCIQGMAKHAGAIEGNLSAHTNNRYAQEMLAMPAAYRQKVHMGILQHYPDLQEDKAMKQHLPSLLEQLIH